jgi:hypothetical protein
MADDVLSNTGRPEDLRVVVAGLHAQYLQLAAGCAPPRP